MASVFAGFQGALCWVQKESEVQTAVLVVPHIKTHLFPAGDIWTFSCRTREPLRSPLRRLLMGRKQTTRATAAAFCPFGARGPRGPQHEKPGAAHEGIAQQQVRGARRVQTPGAPEDFTGVPNWKPFLFVDKTNAHPL